MPLGRIQWATHLTKVLENAYQYCNCILQILLYCTAIWCAACISKKETRARSIANNLFGCSAISRYTNLLQVLTVGL